MSNSPEITDLFSKLAFQLQTLTHTSPPKDTTAIYLSISNLNQSLNLTDNYDFSILDTALSLMCFKTPQVHDCMIQYYAKTIVSVLSSSVSCSVSQLDKEEVLQIGSSLISKWNCVEFIEIVTDVVSKLEKHGISCCSLLCAAARVMVSIPSECIFGVDFIDRRHNAISRLLSGLSKEVSTGDYEETHSRLILWYLDPLTLRGDISNMLKHSKERPFICLNKEFYERTEWRSVLMSLVLSSTMFIHTRSLLHNWFMLTGLGFILEFLIELVSAMLDVLFRPTWWGISIDLGSKLPCSTAYFPYNSHLLRILAGPLSYSRFQQLVHGTTGQISLIREQYGCTYKPLAVEISSLDPKSVWSLAIYFPDWFYFASAVLFSNNQFPKNFQSKMIFAVLKLGQPDDEEPSHAAAARYIAWILSPDNQTEKNLLVDNLIRISEFWTEKQISFGIFERGTSGSKKKLKNLNCINIEGEFVLGNEFSSEVIEIWLKQFRSLSYHGNKLANDSNACGKKQYAFASENNIFFRRIPLGILIGFPSYVNEDGFELILHYVATGTILHLTLKDARVAHIGKNPQGLENLVPESNEWSKKEAVAGVCLIFSLTDAVERMSASLFENEKIGVDVVRQVKLRASRYLTKCLKRLIRLNINKAGDVVLTDLRGRLEQWRHQGQEMVEIDKDLDDVIKGLSYELLP